MVALTDPTHLVCCCRRMSLVSSASVTDGVRGRLQSYRVMFLGGRRHIPMAWRRRAVSQVVTRWACAAHALCGVMRGTRVLSLPRCMIYGLRRVSRTKPVARLRRAARPLAHGGGTQAGVGKRH